MAGISRTLELNVVDRSYKASHIYLTRTLRESEGAFGSMERSAQAAFDKAGASGDRATQKIAARVQEMSRDARADIARIRDASKAGLLDDAATTRQIAAVQERLTTFSRRAQSALASIGTDDAKGLAAGLRAAEAQTRTAAIANARYAAEARGAATATRQAGAAAAESAPRVTLFGRALGAVTALMAGFSVGVVLRGLFSLNSGLEQTRIAFRVMLGDANLADTTLKSLFAFAETTPFMSDEVMQSARSLLAANVAAEDLEPTLVKLGDVAAGVQMPLGELAAIYGKMRTDNRIMGDDLNQLGGRGIPVVAELAKVLGVAQTAIRGMAEKGQIGFAQLEQAFANMSAEGGRFNGLMAEMSESTKGIVDSLADVALAFARDVTSTAFDALSDDVRALRDRINELREDGSVEEWGRQAAASFRTAYEAGRIFLGFLVQWGPALLKAGALVVGVRAAVFLYTTTLAAAQTVMLTYRAGVLLVAAAKAVLMGNTTRATAAMTLFNVAVRANPVGVLVTVLAAAVTAVLAFRAATDRSTAAVNAENQALREKLALLRQMSGAQLFEEQGRRARRGGSLVERVAGVDARIAGLRDGTLAAPRRRIQVGDPQHGGGSRLESQEVANAREIARLTESRVEWNRQLAALGQEQAASDERMEGSLEAQLGFQQRALALLTDVPRARRTEQDNAEIDRLQGVVSRLEAEIAQDAASTGPGVLPAAGVAAPKTRDTSAADANAAARVVSEGRELGEATVSANREREDARAMHVLEVRLEMLDQEKAAAEAVTDAMSDGHARTMREAADRYRFASKELDVRREMVTATENDARDASAETRDRDLGEAARGPAANRAKGREAAEAAHQARLTEITNRAGLERVRLDGEQAKIGFRVEADLRERRARMQEEAHAEAQARTEEQNESDAALAARAATVREQIDAGLIASRRDVAEAQRELGEAYDAAETDEERARIAGLVAELDRLGAALDGVATRAARGKTGRLVDDLEDAVGLADDLSSAFRAMGATVLAGVAGSVGDVLSAVRDVAAVQERVQSGKLSGTAATLAQVGAVAGGVGAALGVIGGVVSFFEARQAEEERQAKLLREQTRALQENTRALLTGGQIGADITQAGADAASSFLTAYSGPKPSPYDAEYLPFNAAFNEALDEVEAAGGDVRDIRAAMAEGNLSLAFDEFRARFGELTSDLGTYAASVGGAFAEFEDAARFLGLEGQAAMAEFFRLLRASGEDLGGLTEFVAGVGSMTDEERTAAVAAIYEEIRSGTFVFGDLTPAEVERILSQALSGAGAGGGPTQAGSVSSITATQGNAVIGTLQEQLRTERAILAGVDAIVAGMRGGGAAPAGGDGAAYVATPGPGTLTVSVPITIDEGQTDEEIGRIAGREVERRLRERRMSGGGAWG